MKLMNLDLLEIDDPESATYNTASEEWLKSTCGGAMVSNQPPP
jgi:hypothetical protein